MPACSPRQDLVGRPRALLRGSGGFEEVSASEPHLPPLLPHCLQWAAGAFGLVKVLEQGLESSQQRTPRHGHILLREKNGPTAYWAPGEEG